MTLEEAQAKAKQTAHMWRLHYVVRVAPDMYEVLDQNQVQNRLRSGVIEQRDIVYVTDGSNY